MGAIYSSLMTVPARTVSSVHDMPRPLQFKTPEDGQTEENDADIVKLTRRYEFKRNRGFRTGSKVFPNPFTGLGGGSEMIYEGDRVEGMLYLDGSTQYDHYCNVLLILYYLPERNDGENPVIRTVTEGQEEENLLQKEKVWLKISKICRRDTKRDDNNDKIDTNAGWQDVSDKELWLPTRGGYLNGGQWLHLIPPQ